MDGAVAAHQCRGPCDRHNVAGGARRRWAAVCDDMRRSSQRNVQHHHRGDSASRTPHARGSVRHTRLDFDARSFIVCPPRWKKPRGRLEERDPINAEPYDPVHDDDSRRPRGRRARTRHRGSSGDPVSNSGSVVGVRLSSSTTGGPPARSVGGLFTSGGRYENGAGQTGTGRSGRNEPLRSQAMATRYRCTARDRR